MHDANINGTPMAWVRILSHSWLAHSFKYLHRPWPFFRRNWIDSKIENQINYILLEIWRFQNNHNGASRIQLLYRPQSQKRIQHGNLARHHEKDMLIIEHICNARSWRHQHEWAKSAVEILSRTLSDPNAESPFHSWSQTRYRFNHQIVNLGGCQYGHMLTHKQVCTCTSSPRFGRQFQICLQEDTRQPVSLFLMLQYEEAWIDPARRNQTFLWWCCIEYDQNSTYMLCSVKPNLKNSWFLLALLSSFLL